MEPTDELIAAAKRRMDINGATPIDAWLEAVINDILAIIKRDYRLIPKPGAARPRRISRVEHDHAALKWARKQAGWKQADLAKAVGISASLLCEAEKGTRGLSRKVLTDIAATLRCPVSVFDRKETPWMHGQQ
ncbi:hypothetical protein ACWT_5695 [Actinoplanes sp. SE50]|uniref:helix-turn-helix domain-containing protein n=1 Tax=unclassified Actinoplanes TaxID=2626549 RepID=UPI00023ED2DE|nr:MULTISPECIES: helix-turn-helix transcriptional regulator [unclassified Actinoplanes]AEV86712.1 hypothetical protein ACPL_5825 [Actinoplanes sp. SE50/110]ATO85110.1 hypothetical protein ACWT_5695 [Actinoplanes sp. SE50]SLM02521.1 XRE family transcriptional regulator [Actinoplanes sp. SE50/110]